MVDAIFSSPNETKDYQVLNNDINSCCNFVYNLMIEKQLKMHLTGKYMRPCPAIITKLYPHQMFALAWMAERENTLRRGEVKGGILADDMGLGKTLTVLSLIMTNCHDNRPLAKPMPGQKRKFTSKTLRYKKKLSKKF